MYTIKWIQTPATLSQIRESLDSRTDSVPLTICLIPEWMIAAPEYSVPPASALLVLVLRYLQLVQLDACEWSTRTTKPGVSPKGSYGYLRKGKDPRAH